MNTQVVDEPQRVVNWKMDWLTHAGFSVSAARKIAESNIDFRLAMKTLEAAKKKGYDEDFVIGLYL